MKPRSLLLVFGLLLLAGCSPKEEASAPVTPPPPGANVAAPDTVPGPTTGTGGLMAVADLPTDQTTEIKVEAEPRSMVVLEHYDQALAKAGWEKYQAPDGKYGKRQWEAVKGSATGPDGKPMGPTDSFDAAWTDPKSGKKALLSLWHMANSPKVQDGHFDVWEKDDPNAAF